MITSPRTRLAALGIAIAACGPQASARPPQPAAPRAPAAMPVPPVSPLDTATQVAVQVSSDSAAIARIIAEGTQRSRVREDLAYLTDVIGPRLSGSPGMKRAGEWVQRKLEEYGADSAWREQWEFGVTWERGPTAVTLLVPHRRPLAGVSWAWSPGTKGTVEGDVVLMDARSDSTWRVRFAGRLRGAWVMLGPAFPVPNPDGPPLTRADSARLDTLRRALQPRTPAEQVFFARRLALLAQEGVAGVLRDGAKDFALYTMSGTPDAISPVVQIVLPNETYAQLGRLLQHRERVRIAANVQNTLGRDTVPEWNTLGDIRGSERPEEIVLLGAHLDSWDLGTGATDNATGVVAVLEAARLLRASGLRPRRSIRFALFSGEEQGLFGSQEYVQMHQAEIANHQAVLVLDNGTGRITGMALQGRNELRDMWRAMFAPLASLGPFAIRAGEKGGTDHLPFAWAGVPAFNYDQLTRGYNHTHHSQVDVFDHAVPQDVMQAAVVLAVNALQLANMDELLPRGAVLRR